MDAKYDALFTPWNIGKVEIKNRIVMCPMGGTSLFGWMELTGCHFDKEAAKFFIEKAQNNVGLIIPGIAPIKSTFMGQWLYQNKQINEWQVQESSFGVNYAKNRSTIAVFPYLPQNYGYV